jgi:hypothetical protein
MKPTKSKGKQKRVVLVDSDILIYRVAAACEVRSVEIKHNKSGRVKVFKNRTAFKDFLKEKEFEYIQDDYTFTDLQQVNEDMSWQFILNNQIKSFKETLWGDELIFLISGEGNFRDELPLPKKYKSNREDTLKPLLRQDCKEYLKGKYKAVVIDGEEVDDAVIWMGYEYLAKGYEVIIVTTDKDANAYSGLKLYNYTADKPEIVEIPELGSLWLDDKGKVRGLGLIHYCHQMLIGDITDGYKPTDLHKDTLGEKSSYSLLKDCTSEQEALSIVISQYSRWYGKGVTYTDCFGVQHQTTWKSMISLYHKCARMKETQDDNLVFYDFAKKYSIDLDNYVEEMQD